MPGPVAQLTWPVASGADTPADKITAMPFARVQRRFTAWLAMLAVVLSSLVPTLAQAVVVASDRSDWMQVCSATGMVWVQADHAVGDTQSAPAADVGMQCPWCSLHSPATSLLPALASGVASAAPASLGDGVMAKASPVGVWIAAPARAPPFVS
jgi:hypothetical protein